MTSCLSEHVEEKLGAAIDNGRMLAEFLDGVHHSVEFDDGAYSPQFPESSLCGR
jgi:hypothetical protein